ncbi:hypothetical protein PTSG_05777 [Salpingoeca rosetta]|uniref:Uncharacterized protein n=1 Tax=Salpingoeca rosetta (strain ATCC 50818 / BSB-021) TaxID=946362 RepID=F2UB72_SALR5|nr:uncharacterized protein PTSG_05777 [Salpingoeca rosetta]EGD74085.1 hypothetical protein PTSG_05777 [Salpingoeca rosetta]|eukprot:XP_004993647.1 hypothetical protein PTSG_05777 [Salpingoeca rosetta]
MEDIVTYETMAGFLGRTTPQLYRLNTNVTGPESYAIWLRFMMKNYGVTVNSTFLNDLPAAVRFFAPQMRGFVTFNASTESLNAAITYCAASDDFVVAAGSDAMISTLRDAGVHLLQDLTTATVASVYSKMKGTLRLRGASFQPPSKGGNLAEYAVFARIPTLEYQGNTGGALVTSVIKDIQSRGNNGFALGWGPEEQYVTTLGDYGMYVHASDWAMDVGVLSNLHVHSNVAPKASLHMNQRHQHQRTSPAAKQSHTVSFLMSDGDNIQWLLNNWATAPQWFGSPDRGKVPMGWTVSPGLVPLAPAVIEYAIAAATANDSFVAGPSGLGYIYPSTFRAATKLMAAGVDVVHPTEFVHRIRTNVVKRCPMPVGSYMDSCSDCTLDDDCMLTCNCQGRGGTDKATCNVSCCSDLSNNEGQLWCNGHQCPSSC